MNIALDFDNTYTADPNMWDTVIGIMQLYGHTVYCVSARTDYHMGEAREALGDLIGLHRCIGTNFHCKKDYVKEIGIHIDVWIDDVPESVVGDHYDDEIKVLYRTLAEKKLYPE